MILAGALLVGLLGGAPPLASGQDPAALAKAAAAQPLIATALDTLRAEALLEAGRLPEARAVAESVIARDRRWAGRASWTAARATVDTDCRAAIAHLERAQPDAPWVRAAPRLALLQRAQAKCGEATAAAETRRTLATQHPDTPEGEAAAKELELTVEQRLARAAAFERARDYVAAAAELSGLLGTPADTEARFRLGQLHLDRLREDFSIAARAFESVLAAGGAHVEEAAYLLARCHGRAGDVIAARQAYDAYLARWPDGAFAEDTRFFSAFLLYENGRFGEAARSFARITRGKWGASAAWYRAWSLWLAGEQAAAVPLLDALAAQAPAGSRAARRAAYWAARALETKEPAQAAARRARLVAERPNDWYALLLRRRFPGAFPAVPPPTPSAAPELVAPPPPALAEAVAEVRALAAAGLFDFARRALGALAVPLRKADAWALERALARAVGDPERRYRAAMIRHHRLIDAAPQPGDADIWRDLFPQGYAAYVDPAARGLGVPPALIYAFIRKESAFDRDAVSPAHAVGLMQLLPRTARGIQSARSDASAPTPDLFDPGTNVELGTWYVFALQARFGGQLPLVAAAYNAGPTSLLGWFRGRASAEADVFVETIPFKETREYVKRMVEARVAYAMVWDGLDLDEAAAVLPLTLDLAVRPGVDF